MKTSKITNDDTIKTKEIKDILKLNSLSIKFEIRNQNQIYLEFPSLIMKEFEKTKSTHITFGFIEDENIIVIHLNRSKKGIEVLPGTKRMEATELYTLSKREAPMLELDKTYKGAQLDEQTFLFNISNANETHNSLYYLAMSKKVKWLNFMEFNSEDSPFIKFTMTPTNYAYIHPSLHLQEMIKAHKKKYLSVGFDVNTQSLLLKPTDEKRGISLLAKNGNLRMHTLPFELFFDDIKKNIMSLVLDKKYYVQSYLHDTFKIPIGDIQTNLLIDTPSIEENIEWIDRCEDLDTNGVEGVVDERQEIFNKLRSDEKQDEDTLCFYTYHMDYTESKLYALYFAEMLLEGQVTMNMTHVIFGIDDKTQKVYIQFNNQGNGYKIQNSEGELQYKPFLASTYWRNLSSQITWMQADKLYSLRQVDNHTFIIQDNKQNGQIDESKEKTTPFTKIKWLPLKNYENNGCPDSRKTKETIRFNQKKDRSTNGNIKVLYKLRFSYVLYEYIVKVHKPYMKCGIHKEKDVIVFELTDEMSVVDLLHLLYPKRKHSSYYIVPITNLYRYLSEHLSWIAIGEYFNVQKSGNRFYIANPGTTNKLSDQEILQLDHMNDIKWIETEDIASEAIAKKLKKRMLNRHEKYINGHLGKGTSKKTVEMKQTKDDVFVNQISFQEVEQKSDSAKNSVLMHLSARVQRHLKKQGITHMDVEFEKDGQTCTLAFHSKNTGIPIVDTTSYVYYKNGIPIPGTHPLSTSLLSSEGYSVKLKDKLTYKIVFEN